MISSPVSIEEAVRIAEHYMKRNIGIPLPIYEAIMTLINTAKAQGPSIKGWVARDEDETLWFHYNKPHKARVQDSYVSNWIWNSVGHFRQLDSKQVLAMFKDLQWEDDPVEVEITIRSLVESKR